MTKHAAWKAADGRRGLRLSGRWSGSGASAPRRSGDEARQVAKKGSSSTILCFASNSNRADACATHLLIQAASAVYDAPTPVSSPESFPGESVMGWIVTI
jgi:hypothetical protein